MRVKNYDFSWLLSLTIIMVAVQLLLNSDCLSLNEINRTPPRQEPLYSEKFLSKLTINHVVWHICQ